MKINATLFNMRYLLLICILLPHTAWAWLSPVEKESILDFREETVSDSLTEKLVIEKLAAMKYIECADIINFPPRIVDRYATDIIPSVKLYSLDLGTSVRFEMIKDPYTKVLFNTCDSTLYHFGGDTFKYSQVMANVLKNGVDNTTMLKLLQFYLNSLSIEDSYYILKSVDDFVEIYKKYSENNGNINNRSYSPDQWHQDIALVENIVKHLKIQNGKDEQRIEFFTWEDRHGKIEYWCFVITPEFIQIAKYRKVLEGVGPHNPLP